jgi:N-acetylmuramoyl-L-alanine amidase/putative methionine-R-sulfoxide reductase with GAF domain
MATTPTKPDIVATTPFSGVGTPAWPRGQSAASSGDTPRSAFDRPEQVPVHDLPSQKPSQRDALQALLAFSALHEQVRRRKALAKRHTGFDAVASAAELVAKFEAEFDADEQFVLDEVLQLVAERAVAITGADGLAIALAENNEIVLRASAGEIRPDRGARIDRDSAFSGACFRSAQIVICDDTETDTRVNLPACRKLGARSMVAVPLCGRRRVIGVLEAFSSWPFAFNESDVRNLSLLAELVLGALKPQDEDRFAQSAQVAATKLELTSRVVEPPKVQVPAASAPVQVVRATPVVAAPVVAAPPAPAPVERRPIVAARLVPRPLAPTPVISAPVVDSKPVEKKIEAASTTAILGTSAILDEPALKNTPDIETAIAAETTVQREFAAAQTETATRRPLMIALLVCIVIGTVVAGLFWLKMKTAQSGSAMIHTETNQTDTIHTDTTRTDTTHPDAVRTENAATSTNNAAATKGAPTTTATTVPAMAPIPSTLADESVEALTDGTDPNSRPATAQELSKFPRVTGIRHWSSADASTVVLDLEDQVQYEAHRLAGPDRIYFDLHDTRLTPELAGKSIDVGDALLSRIRVAQPVSGMTRIVLETKPNTNFSVSLEPNPYRLLVEVRKIGVTPKGAVNLFPNADAEKKLMAIVVPPPTKEDLQLRARVPKLRIVVDAGHGGWDLGTVGRRGLLEKDLVLEIAQRLGKLLESRLGMEVIYTRQDDNYIPLDERASIANQSQADLFVSVHANYSDLPSARGVETYYTNVFSAPGSKEAGSKDADTRVNTTTTANGAKPLVTATLSAAEMHERIEQSRRLAASVQRSLYGTLSVQNPGLRDRGIKEAGFVVLTESAMPGILAEVSFVSSPTDEQKLRSDGYREQIAEALYKGIARYAATSKGVRVAAK